MDPLVDSGDSIPVGTHYRVWWFWLPLLFGCLTLLGAAVLLPIFPTIGFAGFVVCSACLLSAAVAAFFIEKGKRWVQLSDDSFRLSDRHVQAVIHDDQVTDLALYREPHHGAGKLLSETRRLSLWINTEAGPQRVKLSSRMAPQSADPLQPLIDRLCRRLLDQSQRELAAREPVDGDGWSLDHTQLRIHTRQGRMTLPLEDLTAVEAIGNELRLWQLDDPHAVAQLATSGRNGWMLEPLLAPRIHETQRPRSVATPPNGSESADESPDRSTSPSPLGRILFERSSGSSATVLFGAFGLALLFVGGVGLWIGISGKDPVLGAAGGLLLLLSGVCFAAGVRVRRVRFRCHEHGLERITMTSQKLLRFDEIDVFSFERRRNQSQGRYTGTTYTLVFADRSREQGRGIFYSTTVRNTDEELDDLRDRLAHVIARRMAQTFAAHHSVQWTPEVWFRDDVLEYSRPRRMFVPAKAAFIPYDTITDFEVRDGLCYIWTCYQERAVLTVNAGAPNFYPGQILLEGLVRSRRQDATATSA